MEEIIFKVGVNTGNTESKVDGITDSLDKTGEQAKQTDKDLYNLGARFEDIYGELQPLSTRLGEIEDRMYELALAGKQNTDEFRTLQAEVVRYRQTIIETDRAVDLLAEQGRGLGTALQLGNAVVSGYGALQGAMALVGNESEDLQKVMVKLQAVQAVLNSLEQIKITLDQKEIILTSLRTGATKALTVVQTVYTTAVGATTGAMQALRVAMLAIPIVAIIAGIVALISVIADLVSEEEKAETQNEALTKSYERQQAVMDRMFEKRTRDIQNQIDLRKAQGASEDEIHGLEINLLKEQEAQRRVTMRRELSMVDQRRQAYRQALKEGNEDLAREIKSEIEQHRNKFRDLKNLDGQYEVDRKIADTEFQKEQEQQAKEQAQKQREAYKKQQEERKRQAEERRKFELEQERLLQDLIAENIADADQRALVQLTNKHQRELAEIQKKYGKESEIVKQLQAKQTNEVLALIDEQEKAFNEKQDAETQARVQKQNESRKSQLEADLINLQDDFFARMELEQQLAKLEREQQLANKDLTEGEKAKIEAEYQARTKEIAKETEAEKQRLQQETIDKQVEWTQRGLASATALTDAFFSFRMSRAEKGSKEEEKLARKQFQVQKAMNLAGAITDGYKAITSSLAQSPIAIGPLPNPAGIASLAFATSTTLANIAKIASTKFEGNGASGTSVSAPQVTVPTVESGGIPTPDQGIETQGLNDTSKNKVVLVDSDVKASLANSSKVDVIATIGG